MKRRLLVFTLSIIALLITWLPAPLLAEASDGNDPNSAVVLCLPGIYPFQPMDCAPTGPSGYLMRLAEKGMFLPPPPLPIQRPDPALGTVEVRYAEVKNQNAPIYGSIEDALTANKKSAVQRLSGDFVFVSYTDEQELNGKKLYMVAPSQWMLGADLSRLGVLPRFQGLMFHKTPHNAFGWIINYFGPTPLYTKRTPGYQTDDYTSHAMNLHEVVQVFGVERVGEEDWYLVGPDEWVAKKFLALVTPNTTPPQGITGDRWIEVNLYTQTLSVYDQRRLVFATIIASGAEPFWTKPGVFQIYEKTESTVMRGAFAADGTQGYYLEDVPWTMYYDEARALHGAYWRAKLGFPQSHGCINLTVGDAHWLYDWAQVGDWVYVWDPSGQTPTDPSLYGSGGY